MSSTPFNTFRRLNAREINEQGLCLIAVVFKNDDGLWGTKHYHYYAPILWQCNKDDLVCVEAPAGNCTVKVTRVFDNGNTVGHSASSLRGFKTAKWVSQRKRPPTVPSFGEELQQAAGRPARDPYLDFKFVPVPPPAAAHSHQLAAYAMALGLEQNDDRAVKWSKDLWAGVRKCKTDPLNFNRIKPQEPAPMNLTITHQTLINGQNVEHLSDADLFGVIKRAQDEIANLEKIAPDNRPRRLVKRIDELQAGIKALVTLLDERDTKSESKE